MKGEDLSIVSAVYKVRIGFFSWFLHPAEMAIDEHVGPTFSVSEPQIYPD